MFREKRYIFHDNRSVKIIHRFQFSERLQWTEIRLEPEIFFKVKHKGNKIYTDQAVITNTIFGFAISWFNCTVKPELTPKNNDPLSTTTTISKSCFPHLERKETTEKQTPVNKGHYFWVPKVVVVHRFDCIWKIRKWNFFLFSFRFCRRHNEYMNPDFTRGPRLPDHLEERTLRFRGVLQQLISEKQFSLDQVNQIIDTANVDLTRITRKNCIAFKNFSPNRVNCIVCDQWILEHLLWL